jgi:Rrf2 family protein
MNTSSRFVVALHMLTMLAGKRRLAAGPDDDLLSSEVLAGSVNTNPVVIRRIMSQLQDAGIVATKTGRGGGARLARPATQLTLRDVYEAVEDDELFHLHYNPPDSDCPMGGNIQDAVQGIFGDAQTAMKDVLAARTMADLMWDVFRRAGVEQEVVSGTSFEALRALIRERTRQALAVQ